MTDTAKLRELLAKATPGEWKSAAREGDDWDSVVYLPGTPYEICQCFHDESNVEECDANTQLIVALKNHLPALLDEVDALRLLLKECRAILRKSRNHSVNVGDCSTCKLIERIDAAIDSAREGK